MLARLISNSRWHPLLAALVAACIALPMLGWAGLTQSEGHRAIPGWHMLESGNWLRVELFGQPYLRKPPGMPWAIAATSSVFGETEFAARLPSALGFMAMAALATVFARRWFGAPWGLAAGLSQAIMPTFWPWARSAEIEGLHALATQAAVLLLIDRAVFTAGEPGRGWGKTFAGGLLLALALCAMVLLKGPAGAPALGGAILGACIVTRSFRPVLNPSLVLAAFMATAALIPLGRAILSANGESVITQGVGEFLWSPDRLAGIALLIPAGLVAGLPASLTLLFPWGARAAQEAASGAHQRQFLVARALATACVCGLAISALAGVSNVRYVLPVLTLLPPLGAYVVRGALTPGAFAAARQPIARLCLLGHPAVMLAAMLGTAAIWIPLQEQSRNRNSGRAAGLALGAATPRSATVVANEAVEARPEVLHYLRTVSGAAVRWTPLDLAAGRLPPSGSCMLLRTDSGGKEGQRYRAAIDAGTLVPLESATAHQFEFTLFRVADAPLKRE